MKKVYLVRHGETTYNVNNLIQDGSSILTERGQRQAIQVAERVRGLDFQHLVVSDYERTKQTAEPIEKLCNVTIELNPLFREVRRPSEFFHQDRSSEAIQVFFAQELDNFLHNPETHHSDEENFVDVSTRAKQALKYLSSLEGDILVVSHGHIIRHIVAQVATGLTLTGPQWFAMSKSFWATNTGITTLLFEEKSEHWRILTFNDHAHFAE